MESSFGLSPEEMQDVALSEQLTLGPHSITVRVSPVLQFTDYGPDVDVVRAWALREDGVLLALRDLHPHVSRQEAYRLWSFLCQQLVTAARLTYGLREEPAPNPRLGCWGPRPDLAAAGTDDDSSTAVLVGIAIDRRGATQPGRHALLTLAVRSALVRALRYWVAAAP